LLQPDDINDFQNKTYTFSFNIYLRQWYDPCDGTTEPKEVALPEGVINCKSWFTNYPDDLYSWVTKLWNLPAGGPYNVEEDGVYVTWCFEEGTDITIGTNEGNAPPYNAILYSSYDPFLPTKFQDPDWDLVNWIINHKGDYPGHTNQDIQEAIWYFIDGGATPSTAIGQQIVADALAYGEGFIPGSGQWFAVIVDIIDPAGEDIQDLFIEVDP
jgi:hypothetical protein